MDDASFRRLVARYEHDSRDDPQRFAKLSAAMAAFGAGFAWAGTAMRW